MACPITIKAPNGAPSILYNDLLYITKDADIASRLYMQTKYESFKIWFGDSTFVDENGEPKIEGNLFNNGKEVKSIYNVGTFGLQNDVTHLIKYLQDKTLISKRIHNKKNWVRKGETIDGKNDLAKNLNGIDRFNNYYVTNYNAPLIFTYKEGTSFVAEVNELLLTQLNNRNSGNIYYANVSDTIADFNSTVLKVDSNTIDGFTTDEEKYAINVASNILFTEIDQFTKLTIKDAFEGNTIKSIVGDGIKEMSLVRRVAPPEGIKQLNIFQHNLNKKIAEEINKDNSLLWNRIRINARINFGMTITEIDDLDINPNDPSNTFDENLQFNIKPISRISTKIKNLINDTVDEESDTKSIGGLPTTLQADTIIPHLIQNIGSATNVDTMLEKLNKLSKVNKSYRKVYNILKADINLSNLFFSNIKSQSPHRLAIKLNPSVSKFKDRIQVISQNKTSFNQYYLSDSWVNIIKSRINTDFYNASGSLDIIKKALDTYKTSIGTEKLNSLVTFLNTLGVNVTDTMLYSVVADEEYRKDVIGEPAGPAYKGSKDAINDFYITTILDNIVGVKLNSIYESLVKKDFNSFGNIFVLAKVFSEYFMPSTISYTNIEGNQEQSFNKPTFISSWFDMMEDDTLFLAHLKNMVRDRYLRNSNWLFNTGSNNGFLNTPEGVTIDNIDEHIEELTLNKDFYLNGTEKLIDFFFNEGITDISKGKSLRYSDIENEDWGFLNIMYYLNGSKSSDLESDTNKPKINNALYTFVSPADRGNSLFISAPRIRLQFNELEKNVKISGKSELYKAVLKIFNAELTRMNQALDDIYTLDENNNRVYKPIETLSVDYHYKREIDKNGKVNIIIEDENGRFVGDAFKFHNFTYMDRFGKSHDINDIFEDVPDINILNDENANTIITTFISNMLARFVKEQRDILRNHRGSIRLMANNLRRDYDKKSDFYFDTAVAEYAINRYIANVEMMNFFGGDPAFYGNAETANKRMTLLLSSGNVNGAYGREDSFTGVTINDRFIKSDIIEDIRKVLTDQNIPINIIDSIVKSYEHINSTDGFSYITLDEFEKRTSLFGTNDRYNELISKLRDESTDINIDDLEEFLQSQKDIYTGYDYNEKSGRFIPTQVKNSVGVLIPRFIKGTQLEVLHDIAKELEIGQINVESSEKTGSGYIATISDNNGDITSEIREELTKAKTTYYYKNLKKQQDFVNHIVDTINKHAVQIQKRILDNVTDEIVIKEIFDISVANIIESGEKLRNDIGITDNNGVYNIDLNKLSDVLTEQYIQQGLNNNYLFGVGIDVSGTFRLPLDMSVTRVKNEAIINALFTNNVINQKHPGIHGPQVPNAFMNSIKRKANEEGETSFKAASTIYRKLKHSTWVSKENGLVFQEADVLLPAWSKRFFSKDANITIEQLEAAGLTTMLGYRIPTEGKQSMFVFKVVGFLDSSQGSSIVVPDEWIAQSGSDFDIDTIYTMYYNFRVDSQGNPHKIEYSITNDKLENRYIDYVNSSSKQARATNRILAEELKEKAERSYNAYKSHRTRLVKNKNEAVKDEFDNLVEFIKGFINTTGNNYTFTNEINDIFINDVLKYLNSLEQYQLNSEQIIEVLNKYVEGRIDTLSESRDIRIELHTVGIEQTKELLAKFALLHLYTEDSINYIKSLYIDINEYNNHIKLAMNERYWDTFNIDITKNTAILLGLLSIEEFGKLPVLNQNAKQARQNRLLDLYISILSNKDNYYENVSSNIMTDTENAKFLAESFYNPNLNIRNFTSPSSQDTFRKLALAGRQLKAISINRDAFLSIAQRVGLRLTPNKVVQIQYNIGKPVSYTVNSEKLTIPGYTIEQLREHFGENNVTDNGLVNLELFGNNSKSTFTNIDGQLITRYAGESTTHILDNVKHPLPYGVSKYTINEWRLIPDLGGSWNTATLMINQEVIDRINENSGNKNSITSDYTDRAIRGAKKDLLRSLFSLYIGSNREMLNELPIDELTLKSNIARLSKNPTSNLSKNLADLFELVVYDSVKDVTISDEFLIDQLKIKNDFDNIDTATKVRYIENQLAILKFYENLVEINESVSKFQTINSYDSSGAGPEFTDIANKNDLFNEEQQRNDHILVTKDGRNYIDGIYGEDSLYPSLKAYKENGEDISYKAFNELFITQSDAIRYLMNQYPKDQRRAVIDYVMAYNMRTLPFFDKTDITKLLGLNEQSVKGIDITVVDKENVNKFKDLSTVNKLEVFKNQYKDYIDKNNLLNYLFPIASPEWINVHGFAGISFISDINDNEFIDSFTKLWYNENIYAHLLAQDLVKFAYFTKGLTFGRNISKVIPAHVLYNEPIPMEDILGNTFNIVENPLIKGIGFTSHLAKMRLQHFENDFIDPYDIVFKINFGRSNSDNTRIVPIVKLDTEPSDYDEGVQLKKGAINWLEKNPKTDGVIQVSYYQFMALDYNTRKADVVKFSSGSFNGSRWVPYEQLYAKVPGISEKGNNIYFYFPVDKLEAWEFDSKSRIAKNNTQTFGIDYYLNKLSRVVDVVTSDRNSNNDKPNTETNTTSGFQGYRSGFENAGKGTKEGDGKDKAMRGIANSFIGEIQNKNSSSYTSYIDVSNKGNQTPNTAIVEDVGKVEVKYGTKPIVMLARNSEFKGQPLKERTKNYIKKLNEGDYKAEFVVGDMPNVDSQFIDYLQQIGAKFTIYHTGNTPRIKVNQNKPDAKQLSMFANVSDVAHSDFIDYNNARIEFLKNTVTNYNIRIQNFKYESLEKAVKQLNKINWGKNEIAAEASAFRTIADYVETTINSFNNRFTGTDGYSKKSILESILNDPDERKRFTRFMNYSNVFLKGFDQIKNIQPIQGENLTKDEEILNETINRLIGFTPKINILQATHRTVNNLYFDRLLTPLSTNPDIKLGIRNMFAIQSDENKIQLLMDGLVDTNHSFVANFIKKFIVDRGINKTKSKDKLAEHDKVMAGFKTAGRTIEDIMEGDNKLIQEFDQQYKEDWQNYRDKLSEIESNQGKYSQEYYNTEKEYKRWIYDNILSEEANEVELAKMNVNDILYSNFAAREQLDMIRSARRDILTNYNDIIDISAITEDDIQRLEALRQEEKVLSSIYDKNGNEKTGIELDIANSINTYKAAQAEMLDKYYDFTINNVKYKDELEKHKKNNTEEDKQWLIKNTKIEFKQKFWDDFEYYSKVLGKESVSDVLKAVSPYRDKDGIVNGNLVGDELRVKIKKRNEDKFENFEATPIVKATKKPVIDEVYTDAYYNKFKTSRGEDTRDTDEEIKKLGEDINALLKNYINDNGTFDSSKVSVNDLETLKKLMNLLKLSRSYGHEYNHFRQIFNEWYGEVHDTITDLDGFKEADKLAKSQGRSYHNKWRKANTELQYVQEYYKTLHNIAKQYGFGGYKAKNTINNIDMAVLRELYNVNSFHELPLDIQTNIRRKQMTVYEGEIESENLLTLTDYLSSHTYDGQKLHYDSIEKAQIDIKQDYIDKLNEEANKTKQPLRYKSAIDSIHNTETTAKYKSLLKKHGITSKWYLDNHTINYKGEVVPNPYWAIVRPKDTTLYDENAPTRRFWSYSKVKDEKLVDKKKSEGKKWMNDNVKYITTPYYEETKARNKASMTEDEYIKWYEDNHYYNPYTDSYDPISIWTAMVGSDEYTDYYHPLEYMQEPVLKSKYSNNQKEINSYNQRVEEHNANPENKTKVSKVELDDPFRSINDRAMPKKTSKYYYNNRKDKSPKYKTFDEVKADPLYHYITGLMNELMLHYDKSTILDEYELPIMRKQDKNDRTFLQKMLQEAGWYNYGSKAVVGENNDSIRILNAPFLNELIEEKILPIPKEDEFATREEYLERYNEVVAENKVIRAKNKEFNKEHMDKDFESVIRKFIGAAIDHSFVYEHENEMRMALEEIRNLDLAKRKTFTQTLRNITREKLSSEQIDLFGEDNSIATKKGVGSNLEEHFKSFMDMIFYGEFEMDEGNWTKISRVLQNFTSAKGMWINVPGAFNNVAFGRTQMALEHFAGYFYGKKDMLDADKLYVKNMITMIAETGKDTSNSLVNALIKHFNVIKLQDELAITNNEELNKSITKNLINSSSLYLLHHIGEHYMQNGLMLAMLHSNRLVGNKIQSFVEYTFDKHYKALQNILSSEGKHELDKFIRDNKDKDIYFDGKSNLIRDFILKSDNDIQQEFLNELKKIEIQAKEEFNQYKRVIDIYELKEGVASIKEGNNLSNAEFEVFKLKIIKVNQKAQGIYNKTDAGTAQKTGLGRLMFQFKKWMRPGFTKRFGSRIGKTFWNEGRNEYDTGMYVNTYRFLMKPFTDNIRNMKLLHSKSGELSVAQAISNILSDYRKYIGNIGLYWHTLDDTAKADIKRTITEMLLFANFAVLMWLMRGLANGDDEDKKWAYTLYGIDRLKTEILAFNPFYGFTNETRKLLRDPFAAMGVMDDALKLLETALFESDEYYKGGIYHGESKLRVQAFKNIPLFNRYLRFENIQDYAGYYKLY